jgi:hypothetical protein
MTEDIKITIRFGKSNEDITKLKRIMKEMEGLELTASSPEEGRELVKAEFEKRLRDAGLVR